MELKRFLIYLLLPLASGHAGHSNLVKVVKVSLLSIVLGALIWSQNFEFRLGNLGKGLDRAKSFDL